MSNTKKLDKTRLNTASSHVDDAIGSLERLIEGSDSRSLRELAAELIGRLEEVSMDIGISIADIDEETS